MNKFKSKLNMNKNSDDLFEPINGSMFPGGSSIISLLFQFVMGFSFDFSDII